MRQVPRVHCQFMGVGVQHGSTRQRRPRRRECAVEHRVLCPDLVCDDDALDEAPWGESLATLEQMSEPTAATKRLRAALDRQESRVAQLLGQYGATNPRLFGSVARGDAREDSDVDLLVDLAPGAGNEMLRVAGLAEELSGLVGVRVDVVAATLLRDEVSATALKDAVVV